MQSLNKKFKICREQTVLTLFCSPVLSIAWYSFGQQQQLLIAWCSRRSTSSLGSGLHGCSVTDIT